MMVVVGGINLYTNKGQWGGGEYIPATAGGISSGSRERRASRTEVRWFLHTQVRVATTPPPAPFLRCRAHPATPQNAADVDGGNSLWSRAARAFAPSSKSARASLPPEDDLMRERGVRLPYQVVLCSNSKEEGLPFRISQKKPLSKTNSETK